MAACVIVLGLIAYKFPEKLPFSLKRKKVEAELNHYNQLQNEQQLQVAAPAEEANPDNNEMLWQGQGQSPLKLDQAIWFSRSWPFSILVFSLFVIFLTGQSRCVLMFMHMNACYSYF